MLPSIVRRAKLAPLKILFQDKSMFVIDKPAGLVSQGGIDHERAAKGEPTIEDHFYNLKTRLELSPDQWIRNVHRLDKSTTGPLILATTETKARDLCRQFKEREIEKSYIAAISRYLSPEERAQEGEHVGWMESDDGLVSLSEKGKVGAKEVTTEWEWLGGDKTLNISLLRLRPKTGHKHQLRLFCSKFLRSPIIGDRLYRFPSFSSPHRHPISTAVRLRADRILLHCEEITFTRFVKTSKGAGLEVGGKGGLGGKMGGKGGSKGKATRVRETVRASLGRDWGSVLSRMGERKDSEDGVWKTVEEEEWEREMVDEEGASSPVAGGEGEGEEFEVTIGEGRRGGGGGGVVDVDAGPRWEVGTGGGSVKQEEKEDRGRFMRGVRSKRVVGFGGV